jgi:hypothetical protein
MLLQWLLPPSAPRIPSAVGGLTPWWPLFCATQCTTQNTWKIFRLSIIFI